MTTIDFNALMKEAGEGFAAIPEGPYHVEVAKCEATNTAGGKAMFRTQFRVLSGPHQGRLVFTNFVISPESPGALGYFFEHMAALGLPATYFAQNPLPDDIAKALVGRQALIGVGIQSKGQYAGRNEVNAVKPPPVGQMGVAPGAMPAAPAPAPATPPPAPIPAAPPIPPVAAPVAAPPQPPVPPPAPVAPPAAQAAPVVPPTVPPPPAGVVPPQVAPAPPPAPVYSPADEEPY